MIKFIYLRDVIYLWLLLNSNVCFGFYLPGLAPVNYCRDTESLQCKVSSYMNDKPMPFDPVQ